MYNSIAESGQDLGEDQSTINALANRQAEKRYNKAKQQIQTPIELSGPPYSTIRGWISHEALQKVKEQRKWLLEGDLPTCTGSFYRLQRLPCTHTLRDLQEQDQALCLESFHTKWHLNRSDTHRLPLEPCHRSDRIISDSTGTQLSTQREPSAFEVVEAAPRPKAHPKCGSIKTNKQYQQAMRLPLQYRKADYDWCFDWKQMNKRYTTPTSSKEWTEEEMIAYLDWDRFKNNPT